MTECVNENGNCIQTCPLCQTHYHILAMLQDKKLFYATISQNIQSMFYPYPEISQLFWCYLDSNNSSNQDRGLDFIRFMVRFVVPCFLFICIKHSGSYNLSSNVWFTFIFVQICSSFLLLLSTQSSTCYFSIPKYRAPWPGQSLIIMQN